MAKILKVIQPFFVMEVGDTFELSENGTYVSTYTEEFNRVGAEDSNISSSYNSRFEISPEYADELIESGYLENVFKEEKTDAPFVNVFDEISAMLDTYNSDLTNIDKDCEDLPACLKVEKETVLRNMIKVLEHLKSLKK